LPGHVANRLQAAIGQPPPRAVPVALVIHHGPA
jgi:hypothetical protein